MSKGKDDGGETLCGQMGSDRRLTVKEIRRESPPTDGSKIEPGNNGGKSILPDHNVPHRCHDVRAKEKKTSRLELMMSPLAVCLFNVINI